MSTVRERLRSGDLPVLARRVLELGAGGGQNAAAAADAGYDVIAVELVPASVAHARNLAQATRTGTLVVHKADFYTIDLEGPFDVVCYWDGFGVGSDADQRRLLRRIATWLAPDGHALIDISTPWYWAHAAGQEMQVGHAMRRYDFDADACRLLDTWWPVDDPDQRVTQYLRCYSPADLRLLLEGSGLRLAGCRARWCRRLRATNLPVTGAAARGHAISCSSRTSVTLTVGGAAYSVRAFRGSAFRANLRRVAALESQARGLLWHCCPDRSHRPRRGWFRH